MPPRQKVKLITGAVLPKALYGADLMLNWSQGAIKEVNLTLQRLVRDILNLPSRSEGWETLREMGIAPIEDHIRYRQVQFWLNQIEKSETNELLFGLMKEAAIKGSKTIEYLNGLLSHYGIPYTGATKRQIKDRIFGINTESREHLTPTRSVYDSEDQRPRMPEYLRRFEGATNPELASNFARIQLGQVFDSRKMMHLD